LPLRVATQTSDEALPKLRRSYRPAPVQVLAGVFVTLIALWLGVNLVDQPSHFFDLFLVGLTIGMVYALIALGYSLVYGILELINFAHGDVFMLGAMLTTTAVAWFGLKGGDSMSSLLPAMVAMIVIVSVFTGVLNTVIEIIAYRPLRGAPRLAPLITAIGVSFILQTAGLVWKGPAPVSLPDNILPQGKLFHLGEADFGWNQLIVFIVTIPTLVVLVWLVQKTKQGKAMRAVAQDKDAAAMMGIDVNRTISFTFLVAGCLAGFAGVLYALFATNVQYDTGFRLGLFAFTAAVLGGIGNLPGAVLGAICIGLIEAFNDGLTRYTPGSDWKTTIIFAILILILVFRPEGLLGERTPEGG
jgi:branched-chain amino acid transport system permease protein